MQKIFFLSCFLIISSCDLPSEADKDCNGVQGGLAELDNCGVCSGGNTEHQFDSDMDQCEICFGDDICCSELCSDQDAINYCDDATNDLFCIYNICSDYYDANLGFVCDSNGSAPYQIGDQLSCESIEMEFDICYPNDCGTIKLADFEDKNILIIYEFDW